MATAPGATHGCLVPSHLLLSKAHDHKLRLKLLISEYRKLYSSAVIGGGESAEGSSPSHHASQQFLFVSADLYT